MGLTPIYQDKDWKVYLPETLTEYLSLWNFYIQEETTWNGWKSEYKYIYVILSINHEGSGYLYVPLNGTLKSNDINTFDQFTNIFQFTQKFNDLGNFLQSQVFDVLKKSDKFIVRQNKISNDKKITVYVYLNNRTYIYTAFNKRMNPNLIQILKDDPDLCDQLREYINVDVLNIILG